MAQYFQFLKEVADDRLADSYRCGYRDCGMDSALALGLFALSLPKRREEKETDRAYEEYYADSANVRSQQQVNEEFKRLMRW